MDTKEKLRAFNSLQDNRCYQPDLDLLKKNDPKNEALFMLAPSEKKHREILFALLDFVSPAQIKGNRTKHLNKLAEAEAKKKEEALKLLKDQAQEAVDEYMAGTEGATRETALEAINKLPEEEREIFVISMDEHEKAVKAEAEEAEKKAAEEAAAKAKAEVEAKKKAAEEAEAKAKAEEEAKKKAAKEAETKAKAEEEEKKKATDKAESKTKESADDKDIQEQKKN